MQKRIQELLGQAEALRRPSGVVAHLVSVQGTLCGATGGSRLPRAAEFKNLCFYYLFLNYRDYLNLDEILSA